MSDDDNGAAKPAERAPVRYYELLAVVPKQRAEIRVTRDRGRRAWRYNIRVWCRDKLTGEWRPTTRGFAFDEDKLQALRDALAIACERAGLNDDD